MKQSKSPRKKPALCLASTARGWRGIHPASPPAPQSLVSGTEGQPPPSTFQLSKESLLRDGPENRGNGFTGKEEKNLSLEQREEAGASSPKVHLMAQEAAHSRRAGQLFRPSFHRKDGRYRNKQREMLVEDTQHSWWSEGADTDCM